MGFQRPFLQVCQGWVWPALSALHADRSSLWLCNRAGCSYLAPVQWSTAASICTMLSSPREDSPACLAAGAVRVVWLSYRRLAALVACCPRPLLPGAHRIG